jgi:endonuclease/exonuclease/phosphatase family metal-dependent hydrolase
LTCFTVFAPPPTTSTAPSGRIAGGDPQRVAQVIRELGAPVIVGLQEVNWHAERALGGESQAEFLAHLPGYEAIAGSNLIEHRGHYGNMLLTRFPVLGVRRASTSASTRRASRAASST